MEIGIFNETKENVQEINELMEVLKLGLKILGISKCEFNVIFVDNQYIRKLNKEYRGIDKETDVISFALEDDKTFNPDERILGDIYISLDKVHSQALEYGHTEKRELFFLAVHGMLHLLGYDHLTEEDKKIMFELQERILNEAKITR